MFKVLSLFQAGKSHISRTCLLAALGAAASPGYPLALAQSNAPALPPPGNPVLHQAPASASWTIQYSYKDNEENKASGAPADVPGDRLQNVTVTKCKKTYWEQSLWTSGKRGEKWIFEGTQFEKLPGSNTIALVPKPDAENNDIPYFDYSDTDFPDLKDLSLQNYKGVQIYGGKPAYVFEWQKAGRSLLAVLSDVQLPLFFSVRDRLHTQTQTYTFSAEPPKDLIPPEEYLKVLKTHKRGLEALKRQASPP